MSTSSRYQHCKLQYPEVSAVGDVDTTPVCDWLRLRQPQCDPVVFGLVVHDVIEQFFGHPTCSECQRPGELLHSGQETLSRVVLMIDNER